MPKVVIEVEDVLKEIKRLIEFPNATVCKHYAASNLLSMLESSGYELTDRLVSSVVNADDETALYELDNI